MKRNDAFPSRYLSKADIPAPVVAVIASVANEPLGQGQAQEVKPVLSFTGDSPKPMVCNASNWDTLEGLYGEESDNWTGKRIEIWVDPTVMYGGKREGGLRLRAPAAAPANGSGSTAAPKLWALWVELSEQARELGLPVPDLDPAANAADIITACKAMSDKIEAAQAEAF